jgi:hypothetical protein
MDVDDLYREPDVLDRLAEQSREAIARLREMLARLHLLEMAERGGFEPPVEI